MNITSTDDVRHLGEETALQLLCTISGLIIKDNHNGKSTCGQTPGPLFQQIYQKGDKLLATGCIDRRKPNVALTSAKGKSTLGVDVYVSNR